MKQLVLLLPFIVFRMHSQATMGLMQYGSGDVPGYVLFAPTAYTSTYLIDKCGYKVKEWISAYKPGQTAYLLEDGSMIRAGNYGNTSFNAGGEGGVIEKFGWNGLLSWFYYISSSSECQHHDVKVLPNGNVLALVWTKKTVPQATAAGRDPATLGLSLWVEKIVEVQPVGMNGGNVVWEWNVWDHLVQDFDSTKPNYDVVSDHPELFDLNYTNSANPLADWMHFNGIEYNADRDEIVVSSRQMCEIYVIDHSTTTAEAASHTGGNSGKGGDILYRWGNPEAYGRGTSTDRQLFFQHAPNWIPSGYADAGKIMVFNNGTNRPGGNYSTVDVIEPPVDVNGDYISSPAQAFGPVAPSWSYADSVPSNFYSSIISGAYRIPGGHTFITEGVGGTLFEIDSLKNTIWVYKNPVNVNGPGTQGTTIPQTAVFKATYYPVSFPGFAGQDMTPGNPIELNPLTYSCNMPNEIEESEIKNRLVLFPNPSTGKFKFSGPLAKHAIISVADLCGRKVHEILCRESVNEIDLSDYESGIYFLTIHSNGNIYSAKLVKE